MKKNIILSYSLFDQKDKQFNRGGHDPFNQLHNRYWVNIPFIVTVNKLCFPDCITKIHIPKDLESNEMYPFLEAINQLEHVSVAIRDAPHTGTEPTIWRLRSLWDEEASYCFCRDMDSVLTTSEVRIMNHFMTSDFWINNIRGIPQHNGKGTSLMAGLNGFNIEKLKNDLPLPPSFAGYEKFYRSISTKKFFLDWRSDLRNVYDKKGYWGCDQEVLVGFFIKCRTDRVISKILDVFVQPDRRRAGPAFGGKVLPNRHYKVVSLPFESIPAKTLVPQEIANIMNSQTVWCGQPVNTTNGSLQNLLNLDFKQCKEMKQIINSNPQWKQFYKF